jgi:DNA-binding CsgD family transcriptional regulator
MALSMRDARTLVDCVARLYAPPAAAFEAHALVALRDLVPADTRGWSTFVLATNSREFQPSEGLASYSYDPPGIFGLRERIAELAAELFHEHPLVAHYVRTRGRAPATAISDLLGVRAFRRLGVYNEFFRPLGIEDQLAVPLPDSFPRLAGVHFHRSTRSFKARDRQLLDLVGPHLSRAERNAAALRRARRLSAGLDTALATLRAGVLVLAADGRLETASAIGMTLVSTYFGPPGPLRLLPAELRSWVARARKLPAGGAAIPRPVEPLIRDGPLGRIVVRLLPRAADGSDVLVLEERRTVLTPVALASLGVSRREAEVLAWVAAGKSNADTASILGIAVATVKKHLEHAYTKLGVENRQAAAARAREIADAAPR